MGDEKTVLCIVRCKQKEIPLFCRYVNHRKQYPHKVAPITMPEMELLLAKYTKTKRQDSRPTLLNYLQPKK
jgi:hypothetical protein